MTTQPATDCPVTAALKVIGGKWRIPIIWKLASGPVRYNELKRQLSGITNIMLTRSLKELEDYQLLKRIQYSEIPPHVEYELTEDGLNLLPALTMIKDWGLAVIERAPDQKET